MKKSVIRIVKDDILLHIDSAGMMPMLLFEEVAKRKLKISKVIHHPSKSLFKVKIDCNSTELFKVRDYINNNI